MEDRILQLEARRRIFEAIKEFPGIHMRELQRRTGMALGTLRYQLRFLEKHGLIVEKREGRLVTYYPAKEREVDARDKKYLAILRQELPRLIVLHLMMHPYSTHGEMKGPFNISPSTLSYHLKRLMDTEVIGKDEEGRYYVLDEERVAKVLITYRQSFVDAMVDAFVRFWEGRSR